VVVVPTPRLGNGAEEFHRADGAEGAEGGAIVFKLEEGNLVTGLWWGGDCGGGEGGEKAGLIFWNEEREVGVVVDHAHFGGDGLCAVGGLELDVGGISGHGGGGEDAVSGEEGAKSLP